MPGLETVARIAALCCVGAAAALGIGLTLVTAIIVWMEALLAGDVSTAVVYAVAPAVALLLVGFGGIALLEEP